MPSYKITSNNITHPIFVRDFAALAASILHLLLFRSQMYNRLDFFLAEIVLLFIPNACTEFLK